MIVHEYGEVDFSIIWQTATIDIPKLVTAIKCIEYDIGEKLFGLSERKKNMQTCIEALENADTEIVDIEK